MPMGDSITCGPAVVPCWRNLLGARIAMWSRTTSVGPLTSNPGTNVTTALAHAGYIGATIQDLDGIVGTLFDPGNYDPNVTIFSLGTNNTGSAPSIAIAAMKTLVTDILTRRPAMRFVFIGIYFQNAAVIPTQAANAVTLNNLYQSDFLPWVAAQGVTYAFVNPQSAGGPGSGVAWNSTDFYDQLHPNDAGHAKMDLLVWPAFQQVVGSWGR